MSVERNSFDETTIVVTTSLAHALCHLGELIFPSIMVAVGTEFGLARNQTTLLSLLCYVLFGFGALPVGLWADAWDPKRILLIYFFAVAASSLGVVLAPDQYWLFAALSLLGLAISIYHPTGLSMISLGVKARGRAMGINGVAGSLGITLAPTLGQWAADHGVWRLAYAVVAVAGLLCGLIMILALKRHRAAEANSLLEPSIRVPAHHVDVNRKRYFPLVLLMIVMMLAGFNYRCLVTALPSYLGGNTEPGQAQAGGFYASVVMFAGVLGQLLGGLLSDRVGARRVYLYLIAAFVPLAAILAVLGSTILAVVVASLLSIVMFAQQPVENSLLAEHTTAARRSVSYGTKFMLTFGIGALGTQVVGELWHATGALESVFYLIASSAAVMAVLIVLFVWLTRVKQGPQTSLPG